MNADESSTSTSSNKAYQVLEVTLHKTPNNKTVLTGVKAVTYYLGNDTIQIFYHSRFSDSQNDYEEYNLEDYPFIDVEPTIQR